MNKESKNIEIKIPEVILPGILSLVSGSKSLVIFAHGAGSSRLSPRNTFVADYLNSKGFSTLLFDLLTEDEDLVYENRFDIDLITDRLVAATKWIAAQKELSKLQIGYFGASTGAAAALKAAVRLQETIKAIVSRGGRPDLALSDLAKVEIPTLLIVGELDDIVIALNEEAYWELGGIKEMVVIPGATHLFEEPGALEMVAEKAASWFEEYLE